MRGHSRESKEVEQSSGYEGSHYDAHLVEARHATKGKARLLVGHEVRDARLEGGGGGGLRRIAQHESYEN